MRIDVLVAGWSSDSTGVKLCQPSPLPPLSFLLVLYVPKGTEQSQLQLLDMHYLRQVDCFGRP